MGFIKLDRSIQKWQWYTKENMLLVWIDLLTSASYEDNYFEGRLIKKGQVVVGRKKLAEKLHLSEQSIRTCINRLKSTGEITIESTNKYSVITIVKWEDYQTIPNHINQQNNQYINHPVTSKQPASNQQVTTTKEIKEVLEDKESFISNINTDDLPFGIDQKNDAEVEQILDEMEKEENWMKNVNLVESWEDGFQRPPSSSIVMRLMDDENLYGKEMTYLAIREAVLQEKCSIDYVEGILMNWKREGKTIDDLLNG